MSFCFRKGRATSDELGAFKHGATILALENGVPVVPMYLAGLREIRPKGSARSNAGRTASSS
jgi:1-acyl-sn-glycerol-3-phosphate acyltransferase